MKIRNSRQLKSGMLVLDSPAQPIFDDALLMIVVSIDAKFMTFILETGCLLQVKLSLFDACAESYTRIFECCEQ